MSRTHYLLDVGTTPGIIVDTGTDPAALVEVGQRYAALHGRSVVCVATEYTLTPGGELELPTFRPDLPS